MMSSWVLSWLAKRTDNGTLPPTRTSKGRRDMAGVKQARDGAAGILTLDEPASLNAMTPDLLGALAAAVSEMTLDEGVRALVLTGAGGGFCLAMAGDMIVAARSASFIQVFSRIALVPDLGSTWLLPRLIGRQRALELMLLNEPLTAERAQEIGLVRQVVDDAKLMEEALTLA